MSRAFPVETNPFGRNVKNCVQSVLTPVDVKRVSYRTVAVKGLGFYLDFTNQNGRHDISGLL